MTKVNGPLFSNAAHGCLAKELVYGKNFKTNTVAHLRIPKYQRTQLQHNIRSVYVFIAEDWRGADSTIKTHFGTLAEGARLHGYNIFFEIWFNSLYRATYGVAVYGIGRYN